MIQVQIAEKLQGNDQLPANGIELLEVAAREALAHAGDQPDADVTIVLSDDARLQELNRDYLGIDAPTDVLSFPSGEIDPETETYYLGDILISCQRAAAQAQAGGHSIEAELQLLAVHGILHLCGYDHAEPDEKAAMWEMQAEILSELGSAILGPDQDVE